ncbi:MAG TPA: ATP-binding protein, partial [Oligoflexus sp.]
RLPWRDREKGRVSLSKSPGARPAREALNARRPGISIHSPWLGWRGLIASHGNLRGAWDGDRLAQVLSNIVANAIQYGSADKIISVDARDSHLPERDENIKLPSPGVMY